MYCHCHWQFGYWKLNFSIQLRILSWLTISFIWRLNSIRSSQLCFRWWKQHQSCLKRRFLIKICRWSWCHWRHRWSLCFSPTLTKWNLLLSIKISLLKSLIKIKSPLKFSRSLCTNYLNYDSIGFKSWLRCCLKNFGFINQN